jgi:hypothetical protein
MRKGALYSLRFEAKGAREIILNEGAEGGELLRFRVESPLSGAEMYTAAQLFRAVSGMEGEVPEILVEHASVGPDFLPVLIARPRLPENRTLPFMLMQHGFGTNKEKAFRHGIRFAAAGFLTVLPDAPLHGERYDSRAFAERFGDGAETRASLVYRLELLRSTLRENLALLEYFSADPRVDPERISTCGISMGGTVALLAAASDRRVKACAAFLPVTDFENLPESPGLGAFSPGELAAIRSADPLYVFQKAPSAAVFVLSGREDAVTGIEGVRRLDRLFASAYRDRPDDYRYREFEGVGHDVTSAMAAEAAEWLAGKVFGSIY